ncbi:hypothetical protein QWZ04_16920 [Vibrio tapetis subsp. quintayensis]|uniref:hypothetical protein n=1 Tax=Vibrio tapetis TaxID=52443 RepID=UPI0025B5DF54|nr:hypothetical protein [Vibrio tapetis]MDN3681991.1 hypothetical protein [Vibrio tapetis subsp. quintayensis]
MLIEWHPNRLWYADMPCRHIVGHHLRRMIVLKLNDGNLVVFSPIELTTQLQIELSELGPIKAIVEPSPNYHDALSDWWLAYSQAYFFATPSLIQKRSDLNFDAALGSDTNPLWKGQLLQTAILGIRKPRKIVFCDVESKTLILADQLVGNQAHLPYRQKISASFAGAYREFRLPVIERMALENKTQLRASVQEVMTWPFDRMLSSNGLVVEQDAKEAFYEAFWWAFQ